MTQLTLATSMLDLRLGQPTSEALARLSALTAEYGTGLSIDVNHTSEQQAQLLREAGSRGYRCRELGYPALADNGGRAAHPASVDRAEQAEAQGQLVHQVRVASDAGLSHLLVHPGNLTLSQPPTCLYQEFATARPSSARQRLEERTPLAMLAINGLLRALDEALSLADKYGTRILLATPGPYPHQIPLAHEVETILAEFEGAPIGSGFFTDWRHCAELLGQREVDKSHRAWPPDALYLADACGVVGSLPLDSADARWRTPLIRASTPEMVTLRLGPTTTPEELLRSLGLVRSTLNNSKPDIVARTD